MKARSCLHLKTPDGTFAAFYSASGLTELHFPSPQIPAETSALDQVIAWHGLTTAAVLAILAGNHPSVFPPMDLTGHTDFRRKVWEVMRTLLPGKTLTYGEIAERIGTPGAARAVGSACGANPIPLLIPCHRVLAAHQGLGGFSGGLDWKRRLLAIEGVAFREQGLSEPRPSGRSSAALSSLPLFERNAL